MKINEKLTYDADVESVYALITDQAFRSESCEQQGALDYDVSVESTGDGATVTLFRTMPAQMPDFIKKLTGETVQVKQTEVWGAADADGNRAADVKVSIVGQPAEMIGQATLVSDGGGTIFSVDGNVKVSIPFIGKKIEPEVAKAISASLHEEVEFGKQRL